MSTSTDRPQAVKNDKPGIGAPPLPEMHLDERGEMQPLDSVIRNNTIIGPSSGIEIETVSVTKGAPVAMNIHVAGPMPPFETSNSEILARLTILEAKVGVNYNAEAIPCIMVGAILNCPECGLRFNGPSLTATQGSKGANYEHSWDESPKLNGQKCRFKGMKFKNPIVYLEPALTGKQ